MDERTVARVLELLARSAGDRDSSTSPAARRSCTRSSARIVREARALGRRVIDRCNLIILDEPGHEDTAEFLARERRARRRFAAVLPGGQRRRPARARRVRAQHRGAARAERARLRRAGQRARARPRLQPGRAVAAAARRPRSSATTSASSRERSASSFGRLLTLTNMPIRRYADWLRAPRRARGATRPARESLQPGRGAGPDVSHDGVGRLARASSSTATSTRRSICRAGGEAAHDLRDRRRSTRSRARPIATGDHCFGCTAGAGSSCGGALLA